MSGKWSFLIVISTMSTCPETFRVDKFKFFTQMFMQADFFVLILRVGTFWNWSFSNLCSIPATVITKRYLGQYLLKYFFERPWCSQNLPWPFCYLRFLNCSLINTKDAAALWYFFGNDGNCSKMKLLKLSRKTLVV